MKEAFKEKPVIVEDELSGFENFNFDEFLSSRGIPHDYEGADREDLFKKYSGKAMESIEDFLGSLSKAGKHFLNLQDFEYLRQGIYAKMKKWLEEEKSGQLVVAKNMLGYGGFGEVFEADLLRAAEKAEAEDMSDVVIKRIAPNKAPSVMPGLKNSLKIKHKNVMQIKDIEDASGSIFVYMERVDGNELAPELVSLNEFSSVVSQAAQGIQAINNEGFVHRDVKAQNILYKKEKGEIDAKIIDLDLLSDAQQLERAVQEGRIAGTPVYIPPEGFFDLSEIRKMYLKAAAGNEFSRAVIASIMDSEAEYPQSVLLFARKNVLRRFGQIWQTAKNPEEAKTVINGMDLKIDVLKYDVYSLGMMLRKKLADGKGDIGLRRKLWALAEEMTRPLPSERMDINKAAAELERLRIDVTAEGNGNFAEDGIVELDDEDLVEIGERDAKQITKVKKELI